MSERQVKVSLAAYNAQFDKAFEESAKKVRELGSESEKLAEQRKAFDQLGRGALVAGTAITLATALAVKAAMDWESAWAGVTKTVSGSDEELAAVEQGLRDLTSVLPASHQEIAAVAEAAGQLGVETPNVVAFTKTMIDLGETTNLSANDAATALARFVNIMGTSQDEVSNLGSALVGLGNNYATTEREILDMSMRLAGAGRQVGLSEGEVLGLSTALSSVGIEAEAGGSAVSKVMIDIAAAVEEGGDRLDLFAKTAGMSAQQFAAQWREEPSKALAVFVKGLANAESQGGSTLGVLAELGITEVRMRDALLRSASAADMFAGAMEMGNAEFKANNALTIEAAKRYETVESKLAIAGNAVRDAAIDFGDVFLPAVAGSADAVKEFAGFMGDLPDPVQGVLGVLTGSVGVIALVGGTALLAVPKIAEFRIAMQTLGLSMSRFALLGGGAMVALTALVTVIGLVAAAQAEARQKAESYASTFEAGTMRITRATREMTKEALAAKNSFLWMEQDSAFDAAEKLGISLDLVTDAAMGNVQAMKELQKQIDEGADGSLAYANSAVDIENAVKGESASLEEAIRVTKQKSKVTEESVDPTDAAADALKGLTGAAEDSTFAIDETASAIAGFAEVVFGTRDAARAFEQSLDDMQSALDENGATLDITEQAGRDNQAALDAMAKSSLEYAASLLEQTGSQESANEVIATGRQRLIDMLGQFGITGDAAEAYADELGLIPGNVDTAVKVTGIEAAELALQRLARVRFAVIRATVGSQGGVAGAPGVDIYRAGGGPVVGPGTGTSDSVIMAASHGEHVWTAAEVAAAGGHGAVENMRKWVRGGGGSFGGGSGGGGVSSVSLAGATLVATVDGTPLRMVIQDQIVEAQATSDRIGDSGRRLRF